jgi:hypothetical protein
MTRFNQIGELQPAKKRTTAIAFWVSLCAAAYPILAIVIARTHYSLTSKDLSQRTEAGLLLLTFPISLACVFALLISFREKARMPTAIIIWSVVGILLNVLFFLCVGSSY